MIINKPVCNCTGKCTWRIKNYCCAPEGHKCCHKEQKEKVLENY